MPVGHGALDHAQRSAVGDAALPVAALAVIPHPLRDPLLVAPTRPRRLVQGQAGAHDGFKLRARLEQVVDLAVELAITVVTEHQLVVGVEDHHAGARDFQCAGHQLVGAARLRLRFAARGDVDVGGHEAAFVHRTPAQLDHFPAGHGPFELLLAASSDRRVDQLAHLLIHIAGSVVALLGTEAHHVLEPTHPGQEQVGRQAKEAAEVGVGHQEDAVAVDHAERAWQAFDHAGEQLVAALHRFRQLFGGGDVLHRASQGMRHAIAHHQLTHRAYPDRATPGCDQRQFDVERHSRFQCLLETGLDDDPRRRREIRQGLFQRGQVPGLAIVDTAGLIGPANLFGAQVHRPSTHAPDAPGAVQKGLARQQRLRVLAALGHVVLDRHESHEFTRLGFQRLYFQFDPVLAPGLAAVEQFPMKRQARIQGLPDARELARIGAFELHKLASAAPHHLTHAVAGDALEAVIDPGDAALGVGDHDRVGGALRHQRQAFEVDRHRARQRLGSQTRTHRLGGHPGQRQGQQNAHAQHRESGQLRDRLFEGVCAAGVQDETLSIHVEAQLLVVRGGRCEPWLAGAGDAFPAFDDVDAGDPVLLCRLALARIQLERDQVFGDSGDTGQHIAGNQWRIQHTEQPGFPLLCGGRELSTDVDRQKHQEARRCLAIAHQGHGGTERGLATGNGVFDRGPWPGIAAHVGAHGARAQHLGLDVADDVQRVAMLLAELPQHQPRRVARTHTIKVGGQLRAPHAIHQTQAPVAGKLTLQIHRIDERLELPAVDLLAGRIGPASALEPVHRCRQALGDLCGDQLALARELGLGIGLHAARQGPGSQDTGHQAQAHDRHGQAEAGERPLGWRQVWVHGCSL